LPLSFATAANAQSSVTLYGLIDAGFTYVNNEAASNVAKGSAAAFRLSSGNINGSRWGLRGTEDLGGGMKAIFTLESGFSMGDGSALQGGREFGRQAYAGISTAQFGTVTLGRQYDSVVDYLAPMTATGSWGGTYFAHPFDNDTRTTRSVSITRSSTRARITRASRLAACTASRTRLADSLTTVHTALAHNTRTARSRLQRLTCNCKIRPPTLPVR